MIPIKFPESNAILTRPVDMTEEECMSLSVHTDGVFCISCWRPTLRERLSILLFGKVWVWVRSGRTQPPIALDGKKSIFIRVKGD
jgi:hypothetical protein